MLVVATRPHTGTLPSFCFQLYSPLKPLPEPTSLEGYLVLMQPRLPWLSEHLLSVDNQLQELWLGGTSSQDNLLWCADLTAVGSCFHLCLYSHGPFRTPPPAATHPTCSPQAQGRLRVSFDNHLPHSAEGCTRIQLCPGKETSCQSTS